MPTARAGSGNNGAGPLRLVGDALAAVFGWPASLWAAHRARRRLRAFGPEAVLALRPFSRLRPR